MKVKVNVYSLQSDNELVLTINNCARCDKNHKDLKFEKFSKYPIEDTDGTIYNYWSLCPSTNEPILLRIIQE